MVARRRSSCRASRQRRREVGFERSRPARAIRSLVMTCPRESDRNSQLPSNAFLWLETRELGWADWPCEVSSPGPTLLRQFTHGNDCYLLKGVLPEWIRSRVGLVTNRLCKTSRNDLWNLRKPTVFRKNSAGWFNTQTQRDPNKLCRLPADRVICSSALDWI